MREGLLREHALAVYEAGVCAADPRTAVRAHWNINPLEYRNIYVVGAGKASALMAQEAEWQLDGRVTAGLVNVKYGHGATLQRIELNECGHPIPDLAGMRGAQRIADIAHSAGEDDLVLCLISGGASALLPLPVEGVTLEQKQEVTGQLLGAGATIHQMNTVRKHLSRVKGGQLAALAYPARTVALILSDVIGDNLEVIGSGPTAPDPSTVEDARAVLHRFGIHGSVEQHLRETPKHSHAANVIIGSNRLALEAAGEKARSLGYETLLLGSTMQGETRDVAGIHASIAREIRRWGHPVKPPACLISGGETTVTIRGPGKGGRNQEFALAAALGISGLSDTVVLSCGTDGTDGPTDAAGGIVDGTSADGNAQSYLDRNDSYAYLESHEGLVITGPTLTNVMDIHIAMIQ